MRIASLAPPLSWFSGRHRGKRKEGVSVRPEVNHGLQVMSGSSRRQAP